MSRSRLPGVLTLVCGVLPAVLLAAAVAVPAALWSRLPSRVADHWTVTGTANGTGPRLAPFVALGVLVIAGIGVVWFGWAMARRGTVPRRRATPTPAGAWAGVAVITLGLYLTATGTACVIMVAVANLAGGGARSASVGVPGLVGSAGGPLALAILVGYALRRLGGLGATDDGTRMRD